MVSVDYNDGNEAGYHYDLLGSRIDVNENGSVTYYWNNELNQYTQVGTENYSYDDNGNLIDDGVYKYYYDCEDRLTDVNNGSNDKVAGYKYDWAGRRVRKITYYNDEPNDTTEYLYDGWHCIAEYDGETDDELRCFYYGPLIDEPVMMWDVGENEKYYYHYDGLGSVVALSDNSGNIVEKYSYDVFGEPNRVSAIGNPYLFTGRRYDDETGLYYYRYRYYSAATGRFLQTDLLGYYDSLNLYSYCLNNPVNWVDPHGLTLVPLPMPEPGPGFSPLPFPGIIDNPMAPGNPIAPFPRVPSPGEQPEADPPPDGSDKVCKAGGGWQPVPGFPDWDVRHNNPHHDKDYPHDHYRKRRKPYSRKVDPVTGKQRPHGKGIDIDVPDEVIDAGKRGIVVIIIGGIIVIITLPAGIIGIGA